MKPRPPARRTKLLERLHDEARQCTACRLHRTRTHVVPGEGGAASRIMLIGEAPGANEDLQGKPFVGRSGRFLNELLAANGLERGSIYITSSVKCRPPENRTPRDDEMDTCRQLWLERQIELVDPQIIVLLGKAPLRQLFGERKANLSDIHGQVRVRNGRRFLLTYHPAAAMRFAGPRCAMQDDFRKLTEIISDR